jgi:GTP cyclohydrolase II
MVSFKTAKSPLRSEFGVFEFHVFECPGGTHSALRTLGPGVGAGPESGAVPLVRVQSSCLTGTAFHSVLCDCRQQLHSAMRLVGAEPAGGCVLYLDQEGRGHGLREKAEQLALIAGGLDTVEAAAVRGVDADLRDWHEAADILRYLLGEEPIRLLTNNPAKTAGLRNAGVIVSAEVAIQAPVTEWNRAYLLSKRNKMSHRLSLL